MIYVFSFQPCQIGRNIKKNQSRIEECPTSLPSWPRGTRYLYYGIAPGDEHGPQLPDTRNRSDSLVMVAIGWSFLYYVASTADLDLDLDLRR